MSFECFSFLDVIIYAMSLVYARGMSEQQNVAGFPVIAAAIRSKLLPEMTPIRGANEQE